MLGAETGRIVLGRSVGPLIVTIALVPALRAEPAGGEAELRACLTAGEFDPALAMARAAPPGRRDRLLGEVAVAQARADLPGPARNTLAAIRDDQYRHRALTEIAATTPARRGSTGPASPASAGFRGGGSQADFDALMELITTTIAPDSWQDVGGPGAIQPFPTGIYVDSAGLLKRLVAADANERELAGLRARAAADSGNCLAAKASALRKISLTRLEKQLQLDGAFGQPIDPAMRVLAGLQEIQYVLVYPEVGDLVIAGPAGPWCTDAEGRAVSTETGRPVVQLDDLVVVLRNALREGGRFGCAITPRQQNLAAVQVFLQGSKGPIKAGQRGRWLEQLRAAVGRQDIEVYGIDPRTRTARILVEADYRMKLVGMGLEEGTLGVRSYLDSIRDSTPLPMSVLRWWFTLNYKALRTTPARDVFEIDGQGVRVLSENELLTATGRRVHTGQSDAFSAEFAHSFTRHFAALTEKYPIYAELQNVFDLALVAALLQAEGLPNRVGWHLTYFGDPQGYPVALGTAPTQVDSVVNCCFLHRRRFVAGVSGGVAVATRKWVSRGAIKVDNYGRLEAAYRGAAPKNLPRDAWWWD